MDSSHPTILIVDDEEKIRKILKINLQSKYQVLLAQNGKEALQYLQKEPIQLVLTDLRMPGNVSGLDILEYVKNNFNYIPVVIITAYGTVENAVQAMKNGAYDYLLKPIKIADLEPLIEKALHYGQLLAENVELKKRLKKYEGFKEFITVNSRMKSLIETVKQVAATPATVLIQGESGTGKQLLASALHYYSPRAAQPFVEINCGAIPRELLESELFGHEKGAFTGAVQTKKGKFELASGGTLFLDEIGELPLELQVKLLHVLENQRFTRVGGTRFLTTRARIVTATNRDLQKEVAQGRFRSDLYYRLKVVFLQIPPLREREEDIPILVNHFLKKHRELNISGSHTLQISDEALEVLRSYTWPGNVRELENVIQQAIIFTKNDLITIDQLPADLRQQAIKPASTKEELQIEKQRRTERILMDIEYSFLKRLLKATRGNVTRAAEKSGYDRRQIQNLIKKHGINIENFRG